MTYRRDYEDLPDDKVNRDWVGSARVQQNFGFGDYYVEYGARTEVQGPGSPTRLRLDGKALYGNLNLYHGPFSLSWETSDYDRFETDPASRRRSPP